MKLLVTGGAGYIGSVVTHMLAEAGHQVEVLDDLSTGYEDSVHPAARLHKVSIHQVGDIVTPAAAFDGVLHFAGRIAVGNPSPAPTCTGTSTSGARWPSSTPSAWRTCPG